MDYPSRCPGFALALSFEYAKQKVSAASVMTRARARDYLDGRTRTHKLDLNYPLKKAPEKKPDQFQ